MLEIGEFSLWVYLQFIWEQNKENDYFITVFKYIGPIIKIKPIAYTGQNKWLKVICNYREIAPNMAGVKEQIFAKTKKHSYMIMSVVSF